MAEIIDYLFIYRSALPLGLPRIYYWIMKHLKYNVILLLSLILGACSSISEPLANQNLQNMLFETADYIVLESKTNTAQTIGFVYYPGGLVDPHAYLQWQDKLVTLNPGLKIITVKMPSNLAVFGIDKGMTVVKANPSISTWITGGHSLGGTMAAELVNNNQTTFKGLVFIASYPASDILKNWSGGVLSVHASRDGLSTVEVSAPWPQGCQRSKRGFSSNPDCKAWSHSGKPSLSRSCSRFNQTWQNFNS